MSYTLYKFGPLTLGTKGMNNPAESDLTVEARSNLLPLPGGAWYDVEGQAQALMATGTLRKVFTLFDDAGTLEADFRVLRGYVGRRERLARRWTDSGNVEGILARLLSVRAVKRGIGYIEVETTFETIGTHWDGTLYGAWTLDSGEVLDNGLNLDSGDISDTGTGALLLELPNEGNATVHDPTISVTAVGGTITSVTVRQDSLGVGYTIFSPIPAGTSLVLDCATKRVTIGGVAVYAQMTFHPLHTGAEWVVIPPGGADLLVVLNGGSVNNVVSVDGYHDGWY